MNVQFFRTVGKPAILFTLLVLLVLVASAAPTATDAAPKQTYYITAAYPNFTGSTAFTLNHDATIIGGLIRLTRNQTNLGGSAFRTNRVTLPTNFAFSTQFKFRMHSGVGSADGLAFCIQTQANNVGSTGGGLGYQGISPSVCVEFDTHQNPENNDPAPTHIGVMVNGNTKHNDGLSGPAWTNGTVLGCAPPWGGGGGGNFDNGSVYVASIDYDGANMSVYLDCDYSRGGSIHFGTRTINLASIFPSRNVYVGFTAATGASYQQHEIHTFYFQNGCCTGGTPPVDVDAHTYYAGAATVTASAYPPSIPTGGASTITCNAKNEAGANLANQTINVSTTAGTLNPTSGVTDANGNFVTTLTGPNTAGAVNVTCTASTGPYSDPPATVNVVAPTWLLGPIRGNVVSGNPATVGRLTATGTGQGCLLWVAWYVRNPVPGGGAPTYNFNQDWFYDVRQENCTSVQLSFNGAPGTAFWWSGTEWLRASNQSGALIVNITGVTAPNLTQLLNGRVFGITQGAPEVPEASTLLLMGGGLGGAATWLGWQWRRVKRAIKK